MGLFDGLFSSSGSQTTGTTSTTLPKWYEDNMAHSVGKARGLHDNQWGYNPYPGSTLPGMSGPTQRGLDHMEWMATSGDQSAAGNAYNTANNLITGQGITPAMQGGLNTLDAYRTGNSITTAGDFAGVATRAGDPSVSRQTLMGMAQGNELTPGGGNPYYEQMAQKNADDIMRSVNRNSGGRVGSFAHGARMADEISAVNNPLRAQGYEAARARQLGAAGQIDQAEQGLMELQLNALTGQTDAQGRNAANQMGAAGGLLSAYDQGIGRAGALMNVLPSVDAMRYTPGANLLKVGSAYDDREGYRLEEEKSRWEQGDMRPWNLLNAYTATINGVGKPGSTTTTTAPKPSTAASVLGGALGGGLLGSKIPGIGTGIGAIGGGLLGLFS